MSHQHLNVSLEIKALGSREFEGHGSIFGNVDLGGDIVLPGAFKRSLAEHRSAGALPQMFWMHKMDAVPGVWTDMDEDDRGLYVKGELVDTPLGNEMRTLLKRNAVRGLSIGYETRDADFDRDGNRLLKELVLWEVSLVSIPMNPLAQVQAAKKRDLERELRDAGCARHKARQLVAQFFDTDLSAMLDPRWDAGAVDDVDDPEAKAVLEALSASTGAIVREAFRR